MKHVLCSVLFCQQTQLILSIHQGPGPAVSVGGRTLGTGTADQWHVIEGAGLTLSGTTRHVGILPGLSEDPLSAPRLHATP